MLKGFAITPVINGRIAIGEIVEQGGKRLPKKLDHIVITKMHQSNGAWAQHPEMLQLIEAQKKANPNDLQAEKLRSIPVRILFDRPESNGSASYTCFDDKSRLVCCGNGETAKRRNGNGVTEVPCPTAEICDFGRQNRCKQFGRFMFGLESLFENDPLSGFMFRTTSFNSIDKLSYRLRTFSAALNGKMAGLPCNLVMKAKSTAASFRKPIYYLDLEPVGGFFAAAAKAMEFHQKFAEAGLDREKLETTVAEGVQQSAFFETKEDGEEVTEEFFTLPEEEVEETGITGSKDGVQSASGQSTEEPPCPPQLVEEIERLLTLTGRDKAGLLEWLIKPADTSLTTLTREEALRAIVVLSPKEKAAIASSEEDPTNAVGKDSIANQASDGLRKEEVAHLAKTSEQGSPASSAIPAAQETKKHHKAKANKGAELSGATKTMQKDEGSSTTADNGMGLSIKNLPVMPESPETAVRTFF